MKYKTIRDEWTALDNKRSAILNRCEDYARWTLPYLFPQRGTTEQEELSVAAGSIGARSVNHLANKLVSTLFVPYRPFFRLTIDENMRAKVKAALQMTDAQIDLALARTENAAKDAISVAAHRTQAVLAAKNIIVTGNSLLYYPQDSAVEVYNLRDYVIKRNLNGRLLTIITRDTKIFSSLPEGIRSTLAENKRRKYDDDAACSLYTKIAYSEEKKKFIVTQAVDDVELDTYGEYPVDKLPWIVLTWNLLRGEDYGRGLVEDYAYAFHSHQVLTAGQTRLYAVLCDVKWLVEPSSGLDPEELNNAPSGSYFPGKPDSISMPRYNIEPNIVGINEKIATLEREIAQAFLLTSAVTRDAERVTAEEIRMQTMELETSHGGIYSRLAAEWQAPLVGIALDRIGFELGDSFIPHIITGMEAMSRAGDLENIHMFIQDLASTAAIPETFQMYMKPDEFLATLGALRNVQYENFLKTSEEVQQEIQARQEQEQAMMESQVQMQANAATQQEIAKNL